MIRLQIGALASASHAVLVHQHCPDSLAEIAGGRRAHKPLGEAVLCDEGLNAKIGCGLDRFTLQEKGFKSQLANPNHLSRIT